MAQSNIADPRADRLAQAQAAIDAMKDGYQAQLQMDVADLTTKWNLVDQTAPTAEQMDEVFAISHNLKGQAGSFGYELVTLVAASLCDVMRDERPHLVKLKAIGQHVMVLNRIVEKNIVGQGGVTGAKIIEALGALSPGR